jgi:8-oxo-dGTP diphosphatase
MIMAAGGIVLRREQPPLVAVVRLRKRDEWVLPKGKLDEGETPRQAAKREVLEETGHEVTVHEFLGTLVIDTGTRSKVVHYWRMEARDEPTRALMDDIRAVDWLPLDAAIERLSRNHEKTFLENVGPYALAGLIRRTKAKPAATVTVNKPAAPKPAMPRKRRSRITDQPEPMVVPEAALAAAQESVPLQEPALPPIVWEASPADIADTVEVGTEVAEVPVEVIAAAAEPARQESASQEFASEEPVLEDAEPEESIVAAERAPAEAADVERMQAAVAEIRSMVSAAVAAEIVAAAEQADMSETLEQDGESEPVVSDTAPRESQDSSDDAAEAEPERKTLAQKVRGWFGRAA